MSKVYVTREKNKSTEGRARQAVRLWGKTLIYQVRQRFSAKKEGRFDTEGKTAFWGWDK